MSDFIDVIVKGGAVMAPLLACSVIGLAVVIERWLFWRRIGNRQMAETLLDLVERGELNKAAESARHTDSPMVRVLASGLTHRNAMTKALEVAAQREVPVLKQRLTILDTIITWRRCSACSAPLPHDGSFGTLAAGIHLTPPPAALPKR
jgi:biopolymer transport protein ExbB